MIDWDLAVQIAGGGFGMVFLLLIFLAITVWITKLVSDKLGQGKQEK